MPFNEKLKELRLQNSLTQEQLARKLNITMRPYIDYEKGKKYPSVEVLMRMAKLFDVSISFLLDEQNEASTHELRYGTHRADQLVKEISCLLTGEELSETNKDDIMEAMQEAYRIAKKTNK